MKSIFKSALSLLVAVAYAMPAQAQNKPKSADEILAMTPSQQAEAMQFLYSFIAEYEDMAKIAREMRDKGSDLGKTWYSLLEFYGQGGLKSSNEGPMAVFREMAATQPLALYRIAEAKLAGRWGEQKNEPEAIAMYNKAAESFQFAAWRLATFHTAGAHGLAKNDTKALEILKNLPGPIGTWDWASARSRVYQAEPALATEVLSLPATARERVMEKMYWTDQLYTTLFPLALVLADKGDPYGQNYAGRILVYGRGFKADPARGIPYLKAAADSGLDIAAVAVAGGYYHGVNGFQKDQALGLKYARIAADSKDRVQADQGKLMLAMATLDGLGGETKSESRGRDMLQPLLKSPVLSIAKEATDRLFLIDPEFNGKNLFGKVMSYASTLGFRLNSANMVNRTWEVTGEGTISNAKIPVQFQAEMMVFGPEQKPKLFVYFKSNDGRVQAPLKKEFKNLLNIYLTRDLSEVFDSNSNVMNW